ncbi:MAG: ferritin-like domain-containing protein [Leptolyngbyaceae cyanobacterium bins.59]|nr:ferritin-like domain-containing protein [Leptolyngbyaceae cyanobacterium bins.59]
MMRLSPSTQAHFTRPLAIWYPYFSENRDHLLPLPWQCSEKLSDRERNLIAASIRKFQLGESSEGSHLMRLARLESVRSGNPVYVDTLKLFIAEEQRHARDLGRFMEREQIPLAHHDWTDRLFRKTRRLANFDLAMGVLLTAERVATVYYQALRDATQSPLLKTLCQQILQDERQHVRFHLDILATLHQNRPRWQTTLFYRLHELFLAATLVIVWVDHRPVLQAGGFSCKQFFMKVWTELET